MPLFGNDLELPCISYFMLCYVDIQDDERLQRCCGTASWRQLADSWKRLIFNQVQCHLWKTTDSVAGVFKCSLDIVDENTDGLATSG